nr:dimethylsulfonioproprionate lyase family protein [Pseudoruegeria sp. HB172150]
MHFNELLGGLAEVFAKEGRPGGEQASAALRRAQSGRYRRAASNSDPGTVLDAAVALPGALPLAEQVLGVRNLLDWTSWAGEGLAPEVSANLFTAELVGPDGHVAEKEVRVGLLVSRSFTDYPLSSHSGEETYFVLAGTAEWVLEGASYTEKPPGSFVHHPAWARHGRRTLEQPFLGAWRWSGDLDLSSFSVS